jgi:wyosine [tRNA(Phe)-imidazoG37] synthetase (radical SAM superfamily)
MDCIYCQLGSEPRTTVRRRELSPVKEVLAQVEAALRSAPRVDAVTFSGSGEPTLQAGLGRIIRGIKRMTSAPVVVLTNSSLLTRPAARRELLAADIVVPSLDAATEGVFARVNRPHPGLTARAVIEGLVAFRRAFKGLIWLEVLLVKGVNDGTAHLLALRKAVDRIAPDRIHLNTVVRPPAERTARPLTLEEMGRVRDFLGEKAEVVADFRGTGRTHGGEDLASRVLALVRRRPETAVGIARSLGAAPGELRRTFAKLEAEELVRKVGHAGRTYYEPASPDPGKRG